MSFDNICKYLATAYPAAFARWLLATEMDEVELLPAELRLDPIQADTLTLLCLKARGFLVQ
jgi:predicted transposase YdaD